MTEATLQERVIELAHLFGWLVMHTRPARTETGWRTPLQGDPGFPDLVLAREGVVLLAELKAAAGKLTAEQERWRTELETDACASTPQYHLWRPEDLESGVIEEELE